MAGKCRLEWVEDWDDLDLDGNPKMILKKKPSLMTKLIGSLRRRDSKVLPTQHLTTSQQDLEEREHEKEDKDKEEEEDEDSLDEEYGPDQQEDEDEEEKEEEKDGIGTGTGKGNGKGQKSDREIGDDSSVLSSVIPMGLEGGYLQRMKEEAEAAEIATKQAALAEIQRKEALVTDWLEWKCLVCGLKNRRPRHPLNLSYTPAFSEKGIYLKKTHAKLIPDPDIPSCSKCFTLANYHPRLCTAHLFKHYQSPYEAFDNYPEMVPYRPPKSKFLTYFDKTMSCFFGQRNHPDSRLMRNDWRMSIYLSSRFPLVPRPMKDSHELYEIGEIIECKKQKMDWSRGRIIESRVSHVYDIIYDTGDEVRLIEENELRLPPAKGSYAYLVELSIALVILFIPMALMLAIYLHSVGIAFLPFLLFSFILFISRLNEFLNAFIEYYAAGCCLIFQQHLLFLYPLLFLFISTLLMILSTVLLIFHMIPIIVITIFIIFTMFISLPIIYIKRPTFAILALVLFAQLSLCFLLISIRLDGHGKSFIPWVMVDTFPALTSVYTLLRYRRWLGYIWDVSLIIRPVEYSDYEVSTLRQWYDSLKEFIDSRRQGEGGGGEGDNGEGVESVQGKGGSVSVGDLESQTGAGAGGGVPSLEMAALERKGQKEKERERKEREEKERKEKARMMSMSDDEEDGQEEVESGAV
jgi:hypothetical protein